MTLRIAICERDGVSDDMTFPHKVINVVFDKGNMNKRASLTQTTAVLRESMDTENMRLCGSLFL